MKMELDSALVRLMEEFANKGVELYVVGGYVRSRLLNLPIKDVDLCSAWTPEQIKEIDLDGIHISEREFGMGTLTISQQTEGGVRHYEYTAFRTDNYRLDGGHRPLGVTFTKSLEEDSLRRDFTINALYAKQDGVVIDPTNRGILDIHAKKIAQVRPDTLSQDALRILRMVRFSSSLGFGIQKETYLAARENIHKLEAISKERLRDELFLTILADTAYGKKEAVLNGLMMLKDLGVFGYSLPELTEGCGFLQLSQYHAYDVLDHSIHACACSPPDLVTRLAALLHDVAKPSTYRQDGTMYAHNKKGAEMALTMLKRLKVDTATCKNVAELVYWHMFDLTNEAKPKAVIRLIVILGKEQFLRLCDLREADFEGSGRGMEATSAQKWRMILKQLEERGAPIKISDLAVDGNDIMKELEISPGKRVGEILKCLHQIALKKPSQNNYTSLIRYAKMIDARFK